MRPPFSLPTPLKHPDAYLRPIVHLSPFAGKLSPPPFQSLTTFEALMEKTSRTLSPRKMKALLTHNGREALSLALRATVKTPQDLVSILTSSGTGYVSSCVTKTIERYCRWVFGEALEADLFLVIHEFGRQANIPESLKQSGKPILEDCAYALTASSHPSPIGQYGNYLIYSLSKAFPMQYGGLLLTSEDQLSSLSYSPLHDAYLFSHLENGLTHVAAWNQARVKVYQAMQQECLKQGFQEFLPIQTGEIPHAFLIQLPPQVNPQELKAYMNTQGIESSALFQGHAYFVPCHSEMNSWEIEYIFYHLKHFIHGLASHPSYV